jgi:hypothetical protein
MDVSSISITEMALITAHYTSLLSGEKDQEDLLRARGYSEQQIKIVMSKQATPNVNTMGLVFSKPLVKFKYSLMSYLLILLENYERGNLPYPGAVSEQPAQVMEIIGLLQAIKSNFQNAQQAKRK